MLNTPYPFQQKVKRNPSTYQAYEVPDLGNFRFAPTMFVPPSLTRGSNHARLRALRQPPPLLRG